MKIFSFTYRAVIILCSAFVVSAADLHDSFDHIKTRLSEANCVRFEFLSIVRSDIFETADTLAGNALIGQDGKYLISIGSDVYRNDLNEIWSYSIDNNQLVIEPAAPETDPIDQFLFITRLDELYYSSIIEPDSLYLLTSQSDVESDFPDSLIVTIDRDKEEIIDMSYRDFNGEQNRIVVLKTEYPPNCTDDLFEMRVPDSTDVVHLR